MVCAIRSGPRVPGASFTRVVHPRTTKHLKDGLFLSIANDFARIILHRKTTRDAKINRSKNNSVICIIDQIVQGETYYPEHVMRSQNVRRWCACPNLSYTNPSLCATSLSKHSGSSDKATVYFVFNVLMRMYKQGRREKLFLMKM